MPKLLIESTSSPEVTKDGRWRAVLITPGQGSSGFYSESMLREYAPLAFKKGAKSFVTHNRTENGEPDPFRMWGFLAEDAYYEDGVGVVGEMEILSSWREKVEEIAPHVALSAYVLGETDSEGNVTALLEDGQNGVDMVVYPGRPGSGLVEKLYESMIREKTPVEASAGNERKETLVELKDIKEALEESNKALVASLIEALKPAEPEKGEVDFAAAAEAVVAAENLTPKARARVFESVKSGVKVEDAIKAEKENAEEYRKLFEASAPAAPVTVGIARAVEGAGQAGDFSLSGAVGIKVGA